MIGIHTYAEAPLIAPYVSSKQETIFSKEEISKGQVFQKYALMEYGPMFGDGNSAGLVYYEQKERSQRKAITGDERGGDRRRTYSNALPEMRKTVNGHNDQFVKWLVVH